MVRRRRRQRRRLGQSYPGVRGEDAVRHRTTGRELLANNIIRNHDVELAGHAEDVRAGGLQGPRRVQRRERLARVGHG